MGLVWMAVIGCSDGTIAVFPDNAEDPAEESDADTDADVDADTDAYGDTAPVDTGDTDGWPAGLDRTVCGDGAADHLEIQEAIDAAAPGEVIGVCPGTYGPILVPPLADVAILGVDGPEVTTIDGGAASAVYVQGILELTGFRVTGTGVLHDWETDEGGAFTTQEGTLTVRDCVVDGVSGNSALVFDEEYLVMDGVVWEGNDTTFLWFLYQGTDATITGNTVLGGVHESVVSTPDVTNVTITNSLFSDVTIDTARTAFSLTGDGEGTIAMTNNVFYDVDDLDPWGGRLFSGTGELRNNIVVGCDAWNLLPVDASFLLFWDNGVDYGPVIDGHANLFVDPLFVDPANGDFHLQPGSPAIDAGDPVSLDDADGSRNDMGMYGGL